MPSASASSESAFFAEISQHLLGTGDDPEQTVQRMVDRAVEHIGPVSWAGVTLRRRRDHYESVATTHEIVDRLDQLQYSLREGPCLDAASGDGYYLARDLTSDDRWPQWAPRAAQEGAGSVLAIQLMSPGQGRPMGALNLYGDSATEWSTHDLDLALVYAVHATNALAASSTAAGLQTAINSRHDIGIAQGIMMAKYDLTVDQSFEALRRLSSTYNLKLRAVAEEVVRSRGLLLKRLEDGLDEADPVGV